MLSYSEDHDLFYWRGSFKDRHLPEKAGFTFSDRYKKWVTPDKYIAFTLYGHADEAAKVLLKGMRELADESAEKFVGVRNLKPPRGLKYLPFQVAGIWHLKRRFSFRDHLLLADDMGLGKTVQAIGVANELNHKRLLVVCPAHLRDNWSNEIEKWHLHNPGVHIIRSRKDIPSRKKTIIVSYNLAKTIKNHKFDFMVVDEAHFLKSPHAARTELILGDGTRKGSGLVGRASTSSLFLTGTFLPNRAIESWPLLNAAAPDVINNMKYWRFARRFHKVSKNHWGRWDIGYPQREKELSARLRASGFMVRRLKKDVLKDLPPKSYKLVVFPASGERVKKVLHKEKQFDANEIVRHGIPVGSCLPTIRKEMGIAKVPVCASYIKDMLMYGPEKVVVFAWHKEVVRMLAEELSVFGERTITGDTPMKLRQPTVELFQKSNRFRVLIANIQAAGTGYTLTAAHDVIMVEASPVPGDNFQAEDRVHRICQMHSVAVHYLVIEQSLDAKILASALKKHQSIKEVIG